MTKNTDLLEEKKTVVYNKIKKLQTELSSLKKEYKSIQLKLNKDKPVIPKVFFSVEDEVIYNIDITKPFEYSVGDEYQTELSRTQCKEFIEKLKLNNIEKVKISVIVNDVYDKKDDRVYRNYHNEIVFLEKLYQILDYELDETPRPSLR